MEQVGLLGTTPTVACSDSSVASRTLWPPIGTVPDPGSHIGRAIDSSEASDTSPATGYLKQTRSSSTGGARAVDLAMGSLHTVGNLHHVRIPKSGVVIGGPTNARQRLG